MSFQFPIERRCIDVAIRRLLAGVDSLRDMSRFQVGRGGSISQMRDAFNTLSFVDKGAGGDCAYRVLASYLWMDEHRHDEVRAFTASLFDFESCNRDSDGAMADLFPDHDAVPLSRSYSRPGVPLPEPAFIRFKNAKMREMDLEGCIAFLQMWATGAGGSFINTANDDQHSPAIRLYRSDEFRAQIYYDPKRYLSGALKARQIFIRSPPSARRGSGASWIEQFEWLALEVVLGVRFGLLSVVPNGANSPPRAVVLACDFALADPSFLVEAASSPPPVFIGFVDGMHFVSVDVLVEPERAHPSAASLRAPVVNDVIAPPALPFSITVAPLLATTEDVRREIRRVRGDVLNSVQIIGSDDRRVRAKCRVPSCGARIEYHFDWNIHQMRLTCNDQHSCVLKEAPLQTTAAQPKELADAVQSQFTATTDSATLDTMLRAAGYVVSESKLYRTRHELLQRLFGTVADSYAKLRAYLRVMQQSQGDFFSVVDVGVDDEFRRLFVAPGYARSLTAYNVPFVTIDAAHCISDAEGGTWLFATTPIVGVPLGSASERSFQLIAMSYSIGGETAEAVLFLLRGMKNAGLFGGRERVMCMSDGGAAIASAFAGQPWLPETRIVEARDLVHLSRNIADLRVNGGRSGDRLLGVSWAVVYGMLLPIVSAKSVNAANAKINLLQRPGASAAERELFNWIAQDNDRICEKIIASRMTMPKFDIHDSNDVESMNRVAQRLGARSLPITAALQKLLSWANDRFSKMQSLLSLQIRGCCEDDDDDIAPVATPLAPHYRPFYGKTGQLFFSARSAGGLLDVNESMGGRRCAVDSRNGSTYVVDFDSMTCTCGEPQTRGYTCSHARVAVERQRPANVTVASFAYAGMLQEDLKRAFGYVIHTVACDMEHLETDSLHRSVVAPRKRQRAAVDAPVESDLPSRGPGRRKQSKAARLASKGEKRAVRCGVCKGLGHNARSCRRAPGD